ncbi:MAG: hypothetical protein ACRDPY_18905 [Streptosporangiaceae bacterium]
MAAARLTQWPEGQAVLGELDGRGVKFLTLRMRSPALVRHIAGLASKDYKTVSLDRPGPHNKPKVHEDSALKLTSYPGTVRQLVVTGLGRDAATSSSPTSARPPSAASDLRKSVLDRC